MGNRVMERPSLSGGTVPRHLVPKAVRRRRRRALRRTAGVQQSVTAVERPRRQRVPKAGAQAVQQVKPIQAVKPVERPTPKPAPAVAAQTPKPRKFIERLTRKPAPRKAPEGEKPVAPAAQTPPPVQEPEAGKGRSVDLDKLQDGAIEWGIKREEPKDSGT